VVGGVLVGEEGEVSEVPQGAVVLGKAKMRPEVGRRGWRRGGDHR
jgi:hypothetical protein